MTGGLWGKLPARGDFVRHGLGRGFTDAWDAWFSGVLSHSQAALGEAWQRAWLVAPVWRFSLAAGLCGPDAMLGVWMPSVDSAGRFYPLTLAVPVPVAPDLHGGAAVWLDAAEDAGIAALEERLEPPAIVQRLPDLPLFAAAQHAAASVWSKAADDVDTCLSALPSAALFAEMLV